MGEIVGVHGLRGAVKVRSYAEQPDIFQPDMPIFLGDAQGVKKAHTILWVTPHKKALLMGLAGVMDSSLAQSLVGKWLYLPRETLPALEEGTYYWFELIGLSVYTVENRYIGRVESILETGSNDVLVVKDSQREILIPALESVIVSVELKEKSMRVNLPEGLE
ncbi:MAG: ribosome maturation factor RimM [Desulfobacterales bacterium]|jgi:16S rRNA processing protein RimM|nr:ribosome maturation factor RimM [Desulfobacterales bacterium]